MIPKIIHYCWFGRNPIPEKLQNCIDSWKIALPDYQFMLWNEDNCSFDENEFVRMTYGERKLGFIGDYYRLKAVYDYGGIYLDTDVIVKRNFDDLLNLRCFFGFNFDCCIGTAIFGAEKGNPFIKELLDLYDKSVFRFDKRIENPLGHLYFSDERNELYADRLETSNYYWTWWIIQKYPEMLLNNRRQHMEWFDIFPKEYFEIGMVSGRHYSIHLNDGSWRTNKKSNRYYDKLKNLMSMNKGVYEFIQIVVRMRRYRKANKRIPFYEYSCNQKKRK